MKFKLSFIALLLCTLFFACKKNEILNDETEKVSARSVFEALSTGEDVIITPPLTDIPSGMEFQSTCDVSNVPFFIFATVDNQKVTFEFETNPTYVHFVQLQLYQENSFRWNYTRYNTAGQPLLPEESSFDRLEIPFSSLSYAIIEVTATYNSITYQCKFEIELDQSGEPIILALQGTTIECNAQGITYTLVLP